MVAAMDNARQAADDRARGRVHVRVAAGVLLNSASYPLMSVLPSLRCLARLRADSTLWAIQFNDQNRLSDAVRRPIGRPPDNGGRSVRVASSRDERPVGDRRDAARSAAAGACGGSLCGGAATAAIFPSASEIRPSKKAAILFFNAEAVWARPASKASRSEASVVLIVAATISSMVRISTSCGFARSVSILLDRLLVVGASLPADGLADPCVSI